jgi:acetyl-CoA carboxylase carboxyl transferase subunit beta
MNWINKVTPPGLKTIMSRKDTPDDLWVKCPVSGELIYKSDLEATWNVTPAGAHLRISPRARFPTRCTRGFRPCVRRAR